jgi:hypothetical protein
MLTRDKRTVRRDLACGRRGAVGGSPYVGFHYSRVVVGRVEKRAVTSGVCCFASARRWQYRRCEKHGREYHDREAERGEPPLTPPAAWPASTNVSEIACRRGTRYTTSIHRAPLFYECVLRGVILTSGHYLADSRSGLHGRVSERVIVCGT